MKSIIFISFAALFAFPALAEDAQCVPGQGIASCEHQNNLITLPYQDAVECVPGQGVTFHLEKGASITGPMTMSSTGGTTIQPDGTKRREFYDELSLGEGKTITGPQTLRTRTVTIKKDK